MFSYVKLLPSFPLKQIKNCSFESSAIQLTAVSSTVEHLVSEFMLIMSFFAWIIRDIGIFSRVQTRFLLPGHG